MREVRSGRTQDDFLADKPSDSPEKYRLTHHKSGL